MSEITTIEENKEAVGFSGTLELAVSQGASPEVIHSLIDAQERVMSKQAEIDFNEAMSRLQPKLPEIEKASKAHNSKYAKYEHIERQIRPLYTEEGFSISYTSERKGEEETYYGTLSHKSGHSKTAQITLPADTSGSKNPIQAKGSTVSYAKRYLLTMLLNIVTVDEDDDGHAGSTTPLTDEEAAKLKTLIQETGADVKGFLELFNVDDVDSMPRSEFRKAQALLNMKKQTGAEDDIS